jgi:hypothetical protein
LNGLVDYWPMNANEVKEYVTQTNAQSCVGASYVTDRFGQAMSALYLQNGYCQVPSGVYFKGGDFSATVWVKVIQVTSWARAFDFGSGQYQNNILIALTVGTTSKPTFHFYSSSVASQLNTQYPLQLNVWYHLAAVLKAHNQSIYINGVLVASMIATFTSPNVVRTNCYIGKSNWVSDQNANAYVDDLKFYDKALSQEEILLDMTF